MSSLVPESVFELGIEFSEANNVLLMSLMEETQEDEYYGDDRLVSMIQSLEAEISVPVLGQMYEMGHVDDQGCSTSSLSGPDHWVDIALVSSLPFDEMNPWIPCGDEMEHVAMEYEDGNDIDDFHLCYGVFLEQQHRETYMSQGASDAVF
ncbi:uncharacterized protein LOC133297110 [Gastrolobium bilobum]|uniref:uncharacterized protein LOC133297110 n=1 Tax=Gastrolobium bilobum TaxID=150636 RepID=UPI002AB290F4|nr:uncharacterized protein LOC133297110 [Gastrolobium bilobum]